jgi:hypothetical protein
MQIEVTVGLPQPFHAFRRKTIGWSKQSVYRQLAPFAGAHTYREAFNPNKAIKSLRRTEYCTKRNSETFSPGVQSATQSTPNACAKRLRSCGRAEANLVVLSHVLLDALH